MIAGESGSGILPKTGKLGLDEARELHRRMQPDGDIHRQMQYVESWLAFKVIALHMNSYMRDISMLSRIAHRKYTEQIKLDIRRTINRLTPEEKQLYRVEWYVGMKAAAKACRDTLLLESPPLRHPFSQPESPIVECTGNWDVSLETAVFDKAMDLVGEMLANNCTPESPAPADEHVDDPDKLCPWDYLSFAVRQHLTPEMAEGIDQLASTYEPTVQDIVRDFMPISELFHYLGHPIGILRPMLVLRALTEAAARAENLDRAQKLAADIQGLILPLIDEELHPVLARNDLSSLYLFLHYVEWVGKQTGKALTVVAFDPTDMYRCCCSALQVLAGDQEGRFLSLKDFVLIVVGIRKVTRKSDVPFFAHELRCLSEDAVWPRHTVWPNEFLGDGTDPPAFAAEHRRRTFPGSWERNARNLQELARHSILIRIQNQLKGDFHPVENLLQSVDVCEVSEERLDQLYWKACLIWASLNGIQGNASWIKNWLKGDLVDEKSQGAVRQVVESLLYDEALEDVRFSLDIGEACATLWPSLVRDDQGPREEVEAELLKLYGLYQANTAAHQKKYADLEQRLKMSQQESRRMNQEIQALRQALDKEKSLHGETDHQLRKALEILDGLDTEGLKAPELTESASSDDGVLPYAGTGMIFGGHPNWHNKLRPYLPEFDMIQGDSVNFDTNRLKRFSRVYVFTEYCSHKLTYRMKVNLSPDQEIIYLPQRIQTVMEIIHAAEASDGCRGASPA